MPQMQYTDGSVSVINGSPIVTGVGTSWLSKISTGNIFKLNIDGDTAYVVGNIDSDTQITLSANYAGGTASGQLYLIQRDFSIFQGYALPNQGEGGIMDILREKTIAKIDEDVNRLFTNFTTVAATVPGSVSKKMEIFDQSGVSQGFIAVYDAIT